MQKSRQDPYARYDIDDWKWEFLRRNPRYIRAYKAVEWLKMRLSKHYSRGHISLNAFGLLCRFSSVQIGKQWIGRNKGTQFVSWEEVIVL